MAHFIQFFLHVHEFMILCYDTKSTLDSQLPNHVLVGKTYLCKVKLFSYPSKQFVFQLQEFVFSKNFNNCMKYCNYFLIVVFMGQNTMLFDVQLH